MISLLQAAILPLLLLLTPGSAVYTFPTVGTVLINRDITDGQRQKLDDLQVPDCVQKCTDARENNTEPHYIPLCSLTDQSTTKGENDPDVKNAYSCLCTDKVYLAANMACIVKNCGSNSTALDIALTGQYGMCKLYADVIYPKPEVFLNDLCLLDEMPKGAIVPTDVPLVKSIWPDYTFAQDFPKKTATTWAPSGTPLADLYPSEYINFVPQWTCTPMPPTDNETQDGTTCSVSGLEVLTSTNSSGVNSTGVTTDKGTASKGKDGVNMAMVAAAVVGLAIFL